MAADEIGRVFVAEGSDVDRSGHYAFNADLVDAAHAAATEGVDSSAPNAEGGRSSEAVVIDSARRLSLDGFLQRAPGRAVMPGEQ